MWVHYIQFVILKKKTKKPNINNVNQYVLVFIFFSRKKKKIKKNWVSVSNVNVFLKKS